MKKSILLLLLLIPCAVPAQSKDPQKIIDAVLNKFNKINDYKVDASIKLDMSFIKVPEMKAKIYFKKPDKMKIDSDGFAMLPKQGLKFSPAELLNGKFTALYVRSEIIGNRKIDVVKTIPDNDSSDVILSTLWIDAEGLVIKKVETTTKKTGTQQFELSYDSYEYALPSSIKISFNLGDLKMPASPQVQQNENPGPDKKGKNRRGLPEGASLKGSVIMTYSNYQVNKGIPDSFFVEKEKEKRKEIK
jgi:outer membrane lipoprotein-sorting protein